MTAWADGHANEHDVRTADVARPVEHGVGRPTARAASASNMPLAGRAWGRTVPVSDGVVRRVRAAGSTAPHTEVKGLSEEQVLAHADRADDYEWQSEAEKATVLTRAAGYRAAALWREQLARHDVTAQPEEVKRKYFSILEALEAELSKALPLSGLVDAKQKGPLQAASGAIRKALKRRQPWEGPLVTERGTWPSFIASLLSSAPTPAAAESSATSASPQESKIAESPTERVDELVKLSREVCGCPYGKDDPHYQRNKQLNVALAKVNGALNAVRRDPSLNSVDAAKVAKELERIDKKMRSSVSITGADFKSCDSAYIDLDQQIARLRAKFAETSSSNFSTSSTSTSPLGGPPSAPPSTEQ
jgi:hypothetical protein